MEGNGEVGRGWGTETLPLNLVDIVSAVKGYGTIAPVKCKGYHKFLVLLFEKWSI